MELFALHEIVVRKQDKVIIDSISLTIEAGNLYTIYGPSGSGKSTFLRLFNAMTIPSSGTITFHGQDLFSFNLTRLRRRVGLVFQEPLAIEGTVQENLLVPYRFGTNQQVLPSQSELERVLAQCQLGPSFLHQNAARLSGGEKQRMAIARTLLTSPEVLLLDEPTSALDMFQAEKLLSELRNSYPEMTLVVVTHSAELIEMSDLKIEFIAGSISSIFETLERAELLGRLEQMGALQDRSILREDQES